MSTILTIFLTSPDSNDAMWPKSFFMPPSSDCSLKMMEHTKTLIKHWKSVPDVKCDSNDIDELWDSIRIAFTGSGWALHVVESELAA
jgi:hypothetical protein